MNMKLNQLFLLVLFFSFESCSKPEGNTIPVQYSGTKILIHKGGGDGEFSLYPPNSLSACKEGLQYADGIEIDIQKSRSGSAWLYHDEYFLEEGSNKKARLPELYDDEINVHFNSVGNNFSLIKLEEIFEYHQKINSTKMIHLDVKSWLPSLYSDGFGYLNKLADEIIRLSDKYGMANNLIIECENGLLLNRFRKHSTKFQLYLDSYGDFKTAMKRVMKENYTGVSCKVTDNNLSENIISEMHQNGLKVQVWTINNEADLLQYISWKADIILTDNIQFVQ